MKNSINPYTGEKLNDFEELNENELNGALRLAAETFQSWRKTDYSKRANLLQKVSQILRKNNEKYARTITLEMGKPITQAMAEIEKCSWVCDYYAQNASKQLADEIIETEAFKSYVSYEPLGVILAIMPWNYPFWQVFRFAAPNLMAGNVGVLKHASNVMQCGEIIQEVFELAGFPKGCFQHLIIDSSEIASVIANDSIKAVTLTGSKPAGASVASLAGNAIKKTVLELGGNNALVIFDDAHIEKALETCIQARFQNTGQSCIAGKRLLVQRGIALEFTRKFKEKVAQLKSGDPLDKETYIGVLAREDLAIDLEKQVRSSRKMGAEIILGGKRKGTYFEPTILVNVDTKMPIFNEETFGPVIGITIFEKEEDAVKLVNASEFGLGVSIFTRNLARAKRLIPQFYVGAVF
ncbi:MAG: NAD-dependent succinate-semialdehyde dehydrogenase, partial [Maribacter sp.]|nr:NAD-dependent succinate-semialdehyde dehydrogenase [Maribacter sp.]